jgi:hypothetical protein
MITITLWTGLLLTILGLGGFFLTGGQSITALIPSIFGILIMLCALLAQNEKRRRLVMHIAQVLALLGFLGSISGLIKIITYLLTGGMLERASAVIAQSIMAVICLIYLILGIRTFILARKTKS